MSGNPVGWFEIYVQDMARARAFYEAVLGVKLESLPVPGTGELPDLEMCTFPSDMETYGAPGALVRATGVPSGGNSTVVYFSCEDCAQEESRVAAAGGQVHRGKMSIGQYGFITLAHDPDGNLIGLHSLR
jgi:predicted enzyme related to lactoylglutathione lyase